MGLNNISVQEERRFIALDAPAVIHVKPGATIIHSILLTIKMVCWYFRNKQTKKR